MSNSFFRIGVVVDDDMVGEKDKVSCCYLFVFDEDRME
jgi:hypothetical protein